MEKRTVGLKGKELFRRDVNWIWRKNLIERHENDRTKE